MRTASYQKSCGVLNNTSYFLKIEGNRVFLYKDQEEKATDIVLEQSENRLTKELRVYDIDNREKIEENDLMEIFKNYIECKSKCKMQLKN